MYPLLNADTLNVFFTHPKQDRRTLNDWDRVRYCSQMLTNFASDRGRGSFMSRVGEFRLYVISPVAVWSGNPWVDFPVLVEPFIKNYTQHPFQSTVVLPLYLEGFNTKPSTTVAYMLSSRNALDFHRIARYRGDWEFLYKKGAFEKAANSVLREVS